ncbi:MAG: tRNA uridine-5-carboxymethylaminomethyl(34) synthesis GTPase MnmE [Flavobacteriales bacterium]
MDHNQPTDIICALSTPPGTGALAIIRLSGTGSIELLDTFFSRNLRTRDSHTAHRGWIQQGEEKIDDVIVTLFRNPQSFTGEDTVEITCHGSPYIVQRILRLLVDHGAQIAKPGEFSMRAFLHGKMDLSQAEAVGDLIASENAAMHKQALHQMRGGFSKEINALRERLIQFASLVELELDFAEEDVEFADRSQLEKLVKEIEGVVIGLRDSFSLGNAIKNGVPVAILGAPNAGKSTLLNALLNEERAIVSDIAGTTRDTVEDSITLNGIKFIFIDTAGLRATEDVIEKMGIERSYAKARSASVILLVVDLSIDTPESIKAFVSDVKKEAGEDKHYIVVGNKLDMIGVAGASEPPGMAAVRRAANGIAISAKEKSHIEELKNRIASAIESGKAHSGETIVTNARHYEALNKAASSIAEIKAGMAQKVTGDFLAIDIRKTLYHLGEIVGQVNADDLLNSIFSKFCIGK